MTRLEEEVVYADKFEKNVDKLVKTLRVRLDDVPGCFARVARAIGDLGVSLGDIVRVALTSHYLTRDVTIYVDDEEQLARVVEAVNAQPGAVVLDVRDNVLHAHLGGKIEIVSRVPLRTIADLRTAYTPGVAQVCRAIQKDAGLARQYTWIANTVAIVTNATAILGLGDIGVLAGMPVMEGKAVIFKETVGINAVPILVDTKDPDELVAVVVRTAPGFAAIQLEDIAAPTCFEVERKLRQRLPIPVLHDDQHGTATVVLAGLIAALTQLSRPKESLVVVINGAGASGIAVAKMLKTFGVADVILCDRAGAIYRGRNEHMNPFKEEIGAETNREMRKGSLADVMVGAGMFIGLSGPNLVTQNMVRSMAPDPIVFAMANPTPEIQPKLALEAGAAVATDGRTLNNALAYPGLFRGALDANATRFTTDMLVAGARALAEQAPEDHLVPDFLDREVHARVAEAVKGAALAAKPEGAEFASA